MGRETKLVNEAAIWPPDPGSMARAAVPDDPRRSAFSAKMGWRDPELHPSVGA